MDPSVGALAGGARHAGADHSGEAPHGLQGLRGEIDVRVEGHRELDLASQDHLQEAYAGLGYRAGDFPESERATAEVLSIPVYPELTDDQINYVAETIRRAQG